MAPGQILLFYVSTVIFTLYKPYPQSIKDDKSISVVIFTLWRKQDITKEYEFITGFKFVDCHFLALRYVGIVMTSHTWGKLEVITVPETAGFMEPQGGFTLVPRL